MNNVVSIKGAREAPKAVRATMDTLIFSADDVAAWTIPPFQRPLRVNDKVRLLAEQIKLDRGVIPGILTFGTLPGDKRMWLVDGQHRVEAFKLSGVGECICDARLIQFDSVGDMADEFVNLNSSLVRMRPDDILRGLEGTVASLQKIREACPWVGYDQIRRANTASPVLSMSAVLRCWVGSSTETPTATQAGRSSAQLAEDLDEMETLRLIAFLQAARAAWGGDPEYFRLWGGLNLSILMWMWRRLVIEKAGGTKRAVNVAPEQFRRCMQSVSASSDYLDWLVGRVMGNRDRNPCYTRLKAIFAKRIRDDVPGSVPKFPAPAWVTST
jgi:hypothetical protein